MCNRGANSLVHLSVVCPAKKLKPHDIDLLGCLGMEWWNGTVEWNTGMTFNPDMVQLLPTHAIYDLAGWQWMPLSMTVRSP